MLWSGIRGEGFLGPRSDGQPRERCLEAKHSLSPPGTLSCLPKASLAGVASRRSHPTREAGLEATNTGGGDGTERLQRLRPFQGRWSTRKCFFQRQPHTETDLEYIFKAQAISKRLQCCVCLCKLAVHLVVCGLTI